MLLYGYLQSFNHANQASLRQLGLDRKKIILKLIQRQRLKRLLKFPKKSPHCKIYEVGRFSLPISQTRRSSQTSLKLLLIWLPTRATARATYSQGPERFQSFRGSTRGVYCGQEGAEMKRGRRRRRRRRDGGGGGFDV